MTLYPQVTISGLNCLDTSSPERFGLDPSMPPRTINMPQFSSFQLPTVGSQSLASWKVPSPLFTVALILVGQGATMDARSYDLDQTIGLWAGIAGQVNPFTILYATASTHSVQAQARATSFEIERPEGVLDHARLVMVFEIVGGVWRGTTTHTTTATAVGATNVAHVLDETPSGSPNTLVLGSAPIFDLKFRVVGPLTQPGMKNLGTGDLVQLQAALAAGNAWVFDSATLTSRVGSSGTTTFSSGGSASAHKLFTSHGGLANAFRVAPDYLTGTRRFRLQAFNATGQTAATTIQAQYAGAWF